jgi:peptide/nickel transport system ATP-binding protein
VTLPEPGRSGAPTGVPAAAPAYRPSVGKVAPATEAPAFEVEAEAAAPIGADRALVEVHDLRVYFPIRRGVIFDRVIGYVRAVDGVSLAIPRGRTYGLVGESGCGKSTLGRALLQLIPPTDGRVCFDGVELTGLTGERLRAMRRRMQMIFQDPLSSLDPRQNVESILVEGLGTHNIGTDRADRRRIVAETLEAVGLPQWSLSRYPHEFSGGQRQRIGIARALVLGPDLIVADEPVSALDVSIQAQVINLLEELQDRLSLTYLVIAHDLAVVRHISDLIGVMYLGALVEEAPSDRLYVSPLHPYTRALMSAVPVPDPDVEDRRERILLAGDLPSPANPPAGCRFHTRCPWRQPTRCADERPALREIEGFPQHRVACHWAEDIASGRLRPHEVEAEIVRPEAPAPLEVSAPAAPDEFL